MKIVCLEVTNWSYSLNGEHFTGNLVPSHGYKSSYDEKKEVRAPLSAKDAILLNKKDSGHYGHTRYKKGDLSERFYSRDALIKAAINSYKKSFPDADALLLGSACVCDPQQVLDGPKEFMSTVNKLYERRKACGGYEGDAKEADRVFNEYQKLLANI